MKLAVCLLTADRDDYTQRTLQSFRRFADDPDFIRLHADDGSTTGGNFDLALDFNFDTVYSTMHRRGPMAALGIMWQTALEAGATHILHLENDWEFTRAFPLREDAECMRLYGVFKAQTGLRRECGTHRMGTQQTIQWNDDVPGWQRGFAHWAGPPSIVTAVTLRDAWARAKTFKDLSLKLNALDTVRPVENIVWHVGAERTPNARFNV